MSLPEMQTEHMRWTLTPWTERIPEPIDALEEANEYNSFVDTTFAKSDRAFALELSLAIPKFTSVVDIGCGPAGQDIELVRLRPDIHVIGLDYNEEMLDLARHKTSMAGLSDKFTFSQADMADLGKLNFMPFGRTFVFSNTSIHELREMSQLSKTFAGIADLVGENGGCLIRDLVRPADDEQAEDWREEVLKGEVLPERNLELFRNSQRAAFSIPEIQAAIDTTSLKGKGTLKHMQSPQKRYWVYEIQAPVLPIDIL